MYRSSSIVVFRVFVFLVLSLVVLFVTADNTNATDHVYPLIVDDHVSGTYRILAEDESSSSSGSKGGGTGDSKSSSSDKSIKRKKNDNFTEYKMGEAAKSLSRVEYIAVIGGIGFFLFMGAAFS